MPLHVSQYFGVKNSARIRGIRRSSERLELAARRHLLRLRRLLRVGGFRFLEERDEPLHFGGERDEGVLVDTGHRRDRDG